MAELRRCTRCFLPETHGTITFDAEGVCNICRQQEYKQTQIDWAAKKKELDDLIASHRDKSDYDCIIPFSGGKDSTWTLYYLIKEYGLRPLVVRFDHGFLRPNVIENTRDYVAGKLGDRDNIFLAIVLKEEDRHIGNIKLGPIQWNQGKRATG